MIDKDPPLIPILIEKLIFWEEANVRKEEPFEDIDDLAGNIKKNGLRFPLLVKEEIPRKKYLVFSGQRRLMACAKAGLKDIKCYVFKNITLAEARLLSLSENLYRLNMTYNDISNAARLLFEHHKSIDKVANALGVSPQKVKQYLGYNAVPKEIKELVGPKKLTPSQAIDIYTKFPDQNKSIKIAREYVRINNRTERKKFYTAAISANPIDSITQIRKKAVNIKRFVTYNLQLPPTESEIVQKIAKVRFMEADEVLTKLISRAIDAYQKGIIDI